MKNLKQFIVISYWKYTVFVVRLFSVKKGAGMNQREWETLDLESSALLPARRRANG
jgi:hypothetical protein